MRIKIILGISILFSFYLKAQYNLVPNGSFENYSTCPNSSGQISYADFWNNPLPGGSPDYFNSCSPTVGVPSYCHCNLAYQVPKDGSAYAGIWNFDPSVTNGREFIQSQLVSALLPGSCYKVVFYCNLINWSGYATNSLGIFISNNQISNTNVNSMFLYNPQIKSTKIINDTLNWVKIEGIISANGGEKFITIGNFKNDHLIDTLRINTASIYGAYYLIDGISITPTDSIPGGMPAFAGNDVTISEDDSVFIGQEISNLNCTWYEQGVGQIATNTSGLYVKPSGSTSYIVEQNLCGNITYDTVKVNVVLGVNSLMNELNTCTISPNPNTGEFILNIKSKLINEVNLSVMDITGKEVYSENKVSVSKTINLTNSLNEGIYFLRIQDVKSLNSVTKQMCIEK